MESISVVEHIYLLVIVTLMSVLQNVLFSQKIERELMWCAGVCLNQAPAAFAGVIYLVVRQKYFVGYMGQTCQSTPGFLFGKRILSFLLLMSAVGIFNHLLHRFYGSDYKEYVETITNAASALLLIP